MPPPHTLLAKRAQRHSGQTSSNPLQNDMNNYQHVGIIGAGAWGTALAQVCAHKGHQVTLWSFEQDVAETINTDRENTKYLADVGLHKRITATTAPADFENCPLVLSVAPAQHTRATLAQFEPFVADGTPVVLCSKGLEQSSLQLMTQVLGDTIPGATTAVLSGPSFAADVARGLPTAITLACEDKDTGFQIAESLAGPTFRPYWTDDLVGTEIGGVFKNVLAVACGIVEGRHLGASARAALIARGFSEMTRLGAAMGARTETLTGLSGIGDLVLTCTSPMSRNYRFGLKLAEGLSAKAIARKTHTVAEGVATAPALLELLDQHNIDAPLVRTAADIIAERTPVEQAIADLLSRPIRAE